MVIQPCFLSGDPFRNGLAEVWNDSGKRGFIDTKGKFVLPMEFDRGTGVFEGIIMAVKENKLGYYDKSGKCIWDISN